MTVKTLDVNESIFVVVKDNITNEISRVAIQHDTQVGLKNKPSELSLHGRLSYKVREFKTDSKNDGNCYVDPNDCVILVYVDKVPVSSKVNVYLPESCRNGQTITIKDSSFTANVYPINVYAKDSQIDQFSSHTVSDVGSTCTFVFYDTRWYIINSGIATYLTGTSGGSGAPTNASYLVLGTNASLTNERLFSASNGLIGTDYGANVRYALEINQSIVPTFTASINSFTGILSAENGFSGSLTRLTSGISYIQAGTGISVVSQSNGSITISSTVSGSQSNPVPLIVPILNSRTTISTNVFDDVAAFEFNPTGIETMAPSGSTRWSAFFRPIVEVYPTGSVVETRLYNVTANSVVTNSLLSSSAMTVTRLSSRDLTGSLANGTNLYTMQMRLQSGGQNVFATAKGASLFVTWFFS